ncbi:cupin domain-containing protein [Aquisphaera insulae]|uniref:cupin domain-containing protein n=1 Tax=Aquisphaera insulae TaxID=2712864 RepID=UPI0013ECEEC4|nr:cupin domain-containing protein [Aquisphaera insulae]
MARRAFALTVVIAMGAAGSGAAWHGEESESVKLLAERDIAETLDGKAARATAVEVTIEPGKAGTSHRHPGPGFGYILEGEYEWGIDDQPTRLLRAGDTFYEPAGCLHRVSRNPGKVKARLLAWVIHPREAKDIVIPEPNH